MKRKIFLFLCCICVIGIGVGRVLMYLTDREQIVNTATVGQNEISITEVFEPPNPGEKTEKAPSVINTDRDSGYENTVDCYVRGKVFLSDHRVADYLEYYFGESVGFNDEDWHVGMDGWFYYNEILRKNEITEPIFTHIKIDETIPDIFSGFTIDILFESVQADGFDNADEAFTAIR